MPQSVNKIGKKKKRLYKKLGVDYKAPHKFGKVEDMKNYLPKYVIFKSNKSISFDDIIILKNVDYVIQLSVFESIRKRFGDKDVVPSSFKFSEIYNRYRGEKLRNSRVLIWRYGGLGDLICMQPVVRYIKEKGENVEVIFKTAKRNKIIFDLFPNNCKPDFVGDIPFTLGDMLNSDYHLSFEGSIERISHKVKVGRVDSLLKFVGIEDYNTTVELIVPESYKRKYLEYKDIFNNMVILHCRASAPNRSLFPDMTLKLIKSLLDAGIKVGFLDMKREYQGVEEFLKPFSVFKDKKLFNLSSMSENICDAAAMIELCSAYVGIDSGPTHIACGLSKPTIVLCGSFDGTIVYSYSPNTYVINACKYWNGCGMCPCSFHLGEIFDCPTFKEKKMFECMNVFDVEKILDILSNYLI